VGERSYLSIGDVLSLLREEFPDITISKIRFLESRGLLIPERTPSGYRKFYDHDVDRLRWILRQQRENFLPLKVIKGRLEGQEPSSEQPVMFEVASSPGAPAPPEPRFTSHQANGSPGHVGRAPAEAGAAVGRRSTAAAAPKGGAGPGEVMSRPANEPRADARGADPAAASVAIVATDPDGGEAAGRVPGGRDESSAAVPGATGTPPASAPESGSGRTALAAIATARGMSPAVVASAGDAREAGEAREAAGSKPGPGRGAAAGADVGAGRAGAQAGTGRRGASGEGATAGATDAGGSRRLPAAGSHPPGEPGGPPGEGQPRPPARGERDADTDAATAAGESSRRTEAKLDSAPADGASLTAGELAHASGLDVAQVEQLESYGLIESRMVAGVQCYDEDALVVAGLAAAFSRFGVEARHLRLFKHAAERQASLYSQIVMPLLRQRNPDARRRAHDDLTRLTELGASLQACFAKAVLRDLTRG